MDLNREIILLNILSREERKIGSKVGRQGFIPLFGFMIIPCSSFSQEDEGLQV